MGTLEVRNPLITSSIVPTWHPIQRIVFRFVFAYLVLFSLFGGNSLLWPLCDPIVLWVGEVVFGLDITIRPLGSGDTTWNYVQLFCFLVLAVTATLAWSVLDRRRVQYRRLHDWLRVLVRFGLAYTMIGYGAAKAIPTQMPSPSLSRLLERFGEASPMGLLWTFMGASAAYSIFTGVAEMLGGLLLTTRRTTLLGALLSSAAMTHVFMLNLCYDVPVKILSSHLLLMALFLIAPDARRLADLFLFNRRVEPAPLRPLFTRKGLHITAVVLRTVFFALITLQALAESVWIYSTYGDLAPKPPLYGIWNVEQFRVDGELQPPLTTDKNRWQRVLFDWPGALTVQSMNNAKQHFYLKLDTEGKTLELAKDKQSAWKAAFTFQQPEPDLLVLEGTIDGHKVQVTLRRFDESTFLLTSRGFHWINEVPFNR